MAKKDSKDSKNESKVKKHFFKDFKAELKKVIWPTPKQLVNNTVAVITIVLITAAIVFVLDVVFDMGNKYGISNLQNIVNEKFNNDEEENSNTDTDTNNEENNGEEDTTEQNPEENASTEEQSPEETPNEGEQSNPEQ